MSSCYHIRRLSDESVPNTGKWAITLKLVPHVAAQYSSMLFCHGSDLDQKAG